MKIEYVIKSLNNNTYYDGTNYANSSISEQNNFTENIKEAMKFDSKEEILELIKLCLASECNNLTYIELFNEERE